MNNGTFSLLPFSCLISTIARSSLSAKTMSISTGVEKKMDMVVIRILMSFQAEGWELFELRRGALGMIKRSPDQCKTDCTVSGE